MVEFQGELTRTLAAVAAPTRRAVLEPLSDGPAAISQLAAPCEVSFAAVSKHVAVPGASCTNLTPVHDELPDSDTYDGHEQG